MYPVEFEARVRNGAIEIPAQYRDKLKKTVKVIVMAEIEADKDNLIDQLLEAPIRVAGFRPLSRDRIYVRNE